MDELLNDTRNFKPECLIELSGIEHTPERILLNLKKLGAGKMAYLVSTDDETDGTVGELEKILSLVHGEDIVYCLNSKLAYYAGHSAWHYILQAN